MGSVIGTSVADLDTPALLLDRRRFEGNLRRMAEFFNGRPARLRPHFKNHKCTRIARRQLEAGNAVGITCAKLGEAEVLAEAGISDILVANQVVGPAKIVRAIELARRINLKLAIDHLDQAAPLADAAQWAGVTVGVLVEVDIGMKRCGVPPGEPTLDLVRRVNRLEGLRFDGLQAYEGHLVATADVDERYRQTEQAMQLAVETRRVIEKAGIPVGIISGGSTSTYAITGRIEGIDEIQAGTYPTMDSMYHQLTPEFEIALSILSRVISRPRPGVVILDVGMKGLVQDFGPPQIKALADAKVSFRLSEEHATVTDGPDWRLGEAVEIIPSHACTTCNLYRQIHVHESGRVIDVWPIEGSGRLT